MAVEQVTEPRKTHNGAVPPALAALVYADDQHGLDGLLVCAARRLQHAGWQVGGLACERSRYANGNRRMDLVDLRSGERFELSQDLGRASAACSMNVQALVRAGGALRRAVEDGVDLVLVNRFGRAEAGGRGLVPEFAACAQAAIPLVTTVAARRHAGWCRFTGGGHVELPADEQAILRWCRAQCGT